MSAQPRAQRPRKPKKRYHLSHQGRPEGEHGHLSDACALVIRKMWLDGWTPINLALYFRVSYIGIWNILNDVCHVGAGWPDRG